jgi:hypothetical protein
MGQFATKKNWMGGCRKVPLICHTKSFPFDTVIKNEQVWILLNGFF